MDRDPMKIIIATAIAWFLVADANASVSQSFESLAERCAPGVSLVTLKAVVGHESNFNPNAINVNGGFSLPRQPVNRAEAVETGEWLYARGYSFDSGLGQYNSSNLKRSGLAVADLFDPCTNLQASAAILGDCYTRASKRNNDEQKALREALVCYNSGKFKHPKGNNYVALVAANATLPVPALVVTEGESGPVKLRREEGPTGSSPIEPSKKLPARLVEGLGDAFQRSEQDGSSATKDGIGDAFSAENNPAPDDDSPAPEAEVPGEAK